MRVGALQLVLACLVAAVGATGAATTADAAASTRIVGGAKVPITQFPWQAAIVDHGTTSIYQAQFCGAVIVDHLHVITAAHCLDAENPAGVPEDGNTRDVVAGLTDLGANPLPATAQRVQIATWGAMPAYDFQSSTPSGWDAAVATLAPPGLDLSGPAARPAVLAGAGELTPAGAPLRVSGWGVTETGQYPTELRATDLFAVGDPDCEASFDPGDLDRPTMLCAIAPGRDSCNGDSGGPLGAPDGTVVGLVSWGPDVCASSDGAPGVYTELANPDIADYIRTLTPAYTPPASSAPPSLVGLPKSGDTLTCLPGTWTATAGTPDLDYLFRTPEGVVLRDWSASPAFTPGDGDGGRRVVCVERARDAFGAALAASPPSEPVIGPPAPPTPEPPAPQPPATPTPLAPRDVVAPRAAFVSVRCTKRTCRVRVRATDTGNPVSGVRNVRVTVFPGRGRSRTITAKSLGRGLYEVRFTKLRRGTAWFTASARDRAGNVPATVAIRRASVR